MVERRITPEITALLLLLLAGCSRPVADSKPDAPDTGTSVDTQPAESDTTGVDTGESGGETGDTKETNETGETADTDTNLDTGPVLCDRSLGWKYVAAGYYQTCGIHTDGCAECWGRGEAESAPNPDTGVPHYHWHGEDEPPAGDYVSIAMTYDDDTKDFDTPNACGMLADGSVVCWGSGATGINNVPTEPLLDFAVDPYAGYGIDSAGAAFSWGYEADVPGGPFVRVVAGFNLLLLTAEGTLVQTRLVSEPVEAPPGIFLTVSGGIEYPCALKDDGSILCWYYEDASDPDSNPMTLAAPEGPFVDMCVLGGGEGCAMDADGEVTCWVVSGTPKDPPDGETFSKLACGAAHVCGVTLDERMVCWGSDHYGETIPPT